MRITAYYSYCTYSILIPYGYNRNMATAKSEQDKADTPSSNKQSRLDFVVMALPVTTIITAIAGRWSRVDPGDVSRAIELSGVSIINP